MSKLVWDQVGDRLYETGVSNGVIYPFGSSSYDSGVAWNGLTAVTESPSGAEPTALYADNVKYLNLISTEDFGLTIEAYTYPEEFAICDGSAEIAVGAIVGQQPRKTFGLVYKTILGNDTEENNYGYKLHIIYGAKASPSEKSYSTVNESPEAITFSWEVTTTPIPVTGHKPAACITIDSTKADPVRLASLEEKLFGRDAVAAVGIEGEEGYVAAIAAIEPTLVLPDEIISILGAPALG